MATSSSPVFSLASKVKITEQIIKDIHEANGQFDSPARYELNFSVVLSAIMNNVIKHSCVTDSTGTTSAGKFNLDVKEIFMDLFGQPGSFELVKGRKNEELFSDVLLLKDSYVEETFDTKLIDAKDREGALKYNRDFIIRFVKKFLNYLTKLKESDSWQTLLFPETQLSVEHVYKRKLYHSAQEGQSYEITDQAGITFEDLYTTIMYVYPKEFEVGKKKIVLVEEKKAKETVRYKMTLVDF